MKAKAATVGGNNKRKNILSSESVTHWKLHIVIHNVTTNDARIIRLRYLHLYISMYTLVTLDGFKIAKFRRKMSAQDPTDC